MSPRRWIIVAAGVLLVLLIGLGVLVGSCIYMVRQQVEVREGATVDEYEHQAADVMRRFDGVPALVEDRPDGPVLSQRVLAQRQATRGAVPLTSLHVLVFSADDRKLVRLSLPFWLLRMSPNGQLDLGRDDVGLEHLRLTVDDLESAGPGPLFLRSGPDTRVLVWTD